MWFVPIFLTPSELCKSIWQFGVRRMKHTAEVAFVKHSSNSRWLIKLWFLHCLGSCQEEPRWGQEDWQSPYQIRTIHSRHWHQDESAGSCWTFITSYTQHHGTIGQSYSNVFKSGACLSWNTEMPQNIAKHASNFTTMQECSGSFLKHS